MQVAGVVNQHAFFLRVKAKRIVFRCLNYLLMNFCTLCLATMSSLTSSYCSTTSSMSTTDDNDEFDLDDDSICSSMFSVCSSSAGSLSYSNADWTRSASVCSTVTAESVARSLIRQISHKNNWPVDVNVQWLISEKDAPQKVCNFVITH